MASEDHPSRDPSSKSSEDADARIGTILAERYRVFALLGEGGMGRVYAGEHMLMRKRVAIKVLHKELTKLSDIVQRFEREAMAAANIEHPNVAAATDFGKLPDGSIFLVLEYVQGISLRSEIAEGAFALVRALHVARQIASALACAHARGIVHRDLKPENVMLVDRAGDPDFVKVLDFGIAKVPIQDIGERGSVRPGHVITKVGMIFGTPEYMAPEQALGQDVDGRADQYALGVILFEMLTGDRPFHSSTAVGMLGQQLQGPPPKVGDRMPQKEVPPAVEALVARLLSSNRDHRFDDCGQVVEVIENLIFSLQPSVLVRGSRPDASVKPLSFPDTMPGELSALLEPGFIDSPVKSRPKNSAWAGGARPSAPEIRFVDDQGERNVGTKHRRTIHLGLGLIVGVVVGVLGVGFGGWFWAARLRHIAPVGTMPSVHTLHSAVRMPSTTAAPTPVIARAPESELAMARGLGIDELRRLSERYPTDGILIVEIAKLELSSAKCKDAVRSVGRAIEIEPNLKHSAAVATLLWKSVQKKECLEASFQLLEGKMGSRGADILYDLSTTSGVKKEVRSRASAFFKGGHYAKNASFALASLIRLRDASTCEERLTQIEKVLVDGDERVLPILESLQRRDGCGIDQKDDCHPCLRNSEALSRTISVIRARTAQPK